MMAIEATIVEQLQELRRWQLQQQEELIRHQQEQREMLSNEQNRMFESLSLSVDEMSLSEQSLQDLIESHKKENLEKESNLIDLDTPDEEYSSPAPPRSKHFSQYLALTKETNNNNKNLNLKVPIVQLAMRNTKTDLKPNVEYNNSFDQHDYSSEVSMNGVHSFSCLKSEKSRIPIDDLPVPSPKKDFNTLLEERLKDAEAQDVEIKSKSASFTGTQSNNSKSLKTTNLGRCNSLPRSKKHDTTRKSISNIAPIAQQKLTLKNVPPPRKKPSRSMSSTHSPSNFEKKKPTEIVSDPNSSDLEIKSKKELEEVRIFELLEDKAENSSFCSTSSTVIAFLQQSTPLKQKALLHSASKQKLSLSDIGDETLEEIILTTTSNNVPKIQFNGKPIKPRVSNWEDIPISQLKNDKTITGTVLPYGTDVDLNYDKYDSDKRSNQDQNNGSLHVRFSEYNEYKTMTDTSSISSDSQTVINYMNDKGAWSDCSATPDSSDVESIVSLQSQVNNKNYENNNRDTLNFLKKDQDDSDENETINGENNEENVEEQEEEIDYEIELKNTTLQKDDTVIDQKNENASLFKSELLKTRLLELEREIEIFRKESAALTLQRQKLQEERTKLQEERISMQRSLKVREETLEMEKKKTESILQEEKKRLAREKAALESRMKDAYEKAQKSKQERQEIQTLRDQLEELKEEYSQKESKWSATNARQRSQMRVLQTENSKLKQELEKLQQKKNAKFKRPVASSNTKAIHQINKFLADRKKISPFKNDDAFNVEEVKAPEPADANYNVEVENIEEEPQEQKTEQVKILKSAESIARTRNLYESLLRDATQGFSGTHTERRSLMNQQSSLERASVDHSDDEEDLFNMDSATDNNRNKLNNTKSLSPRAEHDESENNDDDRDSKPERQKFDNNKQGIREVHHPDGRVEYWYPNGNVKKVFPDKCLTKTIYYNGDVRETDQNGTVKYFYAATRTWHTTMPDGLEILEFPDGQVERRSKDGTIEFAFPDGSVRIVQADGSEKWALSDGTIAETSADGEKIMTLPNGQREIHTKDHKRREYPDGTVKLVYPDGTQETRYANGRIRLKDKAGTLLMDTHQ
ncbi:hypothetical protein TSAR_000411 [Trichomalopsis sarcophagae]|uniref:Centromere protein J C-terminal domain-containing protein n=1 Tax=Trichomalopsis sarcophagae TaxID=543379 RepID=A0A232EP68_9HYME|nr:hypothetical protein TSAR_000411 [Trichomalopsis sarcophagae]